MKNKAIIVISIIVILLVSYGVYSYYKGFDIATSITEYIDDDSEHDPYDYSSNVPDEISSTDAWISFTSSEYYSSDQEYVFKVADDMITCDLYLDEYYIFIESVYCETIIEICDPDTMDTLAIFE